jgi:hypothetical protein
LGIALPWLAHAGGSPGKSAAARSGAKTAADEATAKIRREVSFGCTMSLGGKEVKKGNEVKKGRPRRWATGK